MTYLLDTNTVSYIVRGQSRSARRKLEQASVDHDVCISVITEAEIRFGLARGKLSAATEAAVELFLSKIDILPWDSAAARAYAKARSALERIGRPLANMDLLIAAHAAALGGILVTNDQALRECSKTYRREADGQLGERYRGKELMHVWYNPVPICRLSYAKRP